MTFYETEIKRIRDICYANDKQLETVISIRRFMEENLAESLDLDALSKVGFTSKYHLLRLFKRYYGVTPKQYQIDKRIERAKVLLQEGTSVTETCLSVGFESIGSFSTLFKNKTGCSPISYQKAQLSRST